MVGGVASASKRSPNPRSVHASKLFSPHAARTSSWSLLDGTPHLEHRPCRAGCQIAPGIRCGGGFLPRTGFQGTNPEIHFQWQAATRVVHSLPHRRTQCQPRCPQLLGRVGVRLRGAHHPDAPSFAPSMGSRVLVLSLSAKGRVSQCANNSTRSRDSGWKVPMMFFMFRMVPSKARARPLGRSPRPRVGPIRPRASRHRRHGVPCWEPEDQMRPDSPRTRRPSPHRSQGR